MARYLFQHRSSLDKPVARVAIYGAGDMGARACTVLLGGPHYEPVAFIDDKKSLQGSSINGIRVYGLDADALARVAARINAPTLADLAEPVLEVPATAGPMAFRTIGAWG
jgi:FlaA1/EpsC-like NDP-sugar epimerase